MSTSTERDPAAGPGRFLFVPVSGPGGSGEYYRSLAIARGVHARWPGSDIRFVVHRGAPYAAQCPYPAVLLEDSPTRAVAPVVGLIEAFRPHVVLFDSAGRVAQLRAAGRVGAVRIYLSSRPKTRWKGFRPSRLRRLEEHWIASPPFLGLALTPLERLSLWLAPNATVRFLPTFYEAPGPAQAAAALARLDLVPGGYVLCCPGGGGTFEGIASPSAVFAEAAARLARATPLPVVLAGAAEGTRADGVRLAGVLPNADLMALAGAARLCVINGGSLLVQCLAQGAACVAAPIAGDQARRIEACVRAGLARASGYAAPALAASAAAALADPGGLDALRAAARALGLRNGVDLAVEAIDALLARRLARAAP